MSNTMKYYGHYRGQVKQCLNNGFCRIWIPGILECVDNDINTLPLAEPAQPIGGGDDMDSGSYAYPALESIVWCFFEGGNIERPVYFATSNVKSKMWDDVSTTPGQPKNKGNDGEAVIPSGILTKFNNSTIHQQSVIEKNSAKPIADKIDIKVESLSELENMFTQNTTPINGESMGNVNAGFQSPTAAHIHMDNKRNIVSITAKDTISLNAPNIIIDTTGTGRPGSLTVKSDNTEFVGNNGTFRVLQSAVNIDAGTNDIILQTIGDILQLKNTSQPSESMISQNSQGSQGASNSSIPQGG